MSTLEQERLSQLTKLLIFVFTIIATELESNVGLYVAVLIWLEFDIILNTERRVIEYLRLNKKDKG